jgi:hypothetical protein
MLLTLRLISIDDLAGESADNQSLSSNPDDRSSGLGPDGRDRDLNVEAGSDNGRSESAMFELGFERQSESGIEDSEDIDWSYILGSPVLDEQPSENTNTDMDVSDIKSEPAMDTRPKENLTWERSNVGNTDFSSVHYVLDLLLAAKHSGRGVVQPAEQDIRNLCTEAREIFLAQPMLLELEAPINVYRSLDFANTWTTQTNVNRS